MTSPEFLQQRLIGYARVSTGDQELSLQIDSLLNHGVKREHIFSDKLFGAIADRPGLALFEVAMFSVPGKDWYCIKDEHPRNSWIFGFSPATQECSR